MNHLRLIVIGAILFVAGLTTSIFRTYAYNYESAIEDAIDTSVTDDAINLKNILERRSIIPNSTPGSTIRDFIARIGVEILIPLFIYVGIIIAIIGFYKLMTAKSDEDTKKATNYLIRWTIGIVIMVTAGYIVNRLWGEEGTANIFGAVGASSRTDVSGLRFAMDIYDQIIFPLLKLAILIILGIFFVMAVIAWFRYLFSSNDDTQQKALKTLLRTTLGSVVIILAKEMVEAIYGDYASVMEWTPTNLGEVGTGLFESPQFPLLYTAINWFLGLVMFLVLIIIVYQGYLLLARPTDDDTMQKLKRNFIYIFVGILVIGAAYLISNFFIIK